MHVGNAHMHSAAGMVLIGLRSNATTYFSQDEVLLIETNKQKHEFNKQECVMCECETDTSSNENTMISARERIHTF